LPLPRSSQLLSLVVWPSGRAHAVAVNRSPFIVCVHVSFPVHRSFSSLNSLFDVGCIR
jgi:hypothetical protein